MVLLKPTVFIAFIGASWFLDGNSVLAASAPQSMSQHTIGHFPQPVGTEAKLSNAPLPFGPTGEVNSQLTGPYRGPNLQPTGSNGGAIPQLTGPNGGLSPQPYGPNRSYMPVQGPYMSQQGPYGPYMRQPQPYGPYMPQTGPYAAYMPQPAPYGPYMPQGPYPYMMPPTPMMGMRPNGASQNQPKPNLNAVKATHFLSFLNGQALNNMEIELGK